MKAPCRVVSERRTVRRVYPRRVGTGVLVGLGTAVVVLLALLGGMRPPIAATTWRTPLASTGSNPVERRLTASRPVLRVVLAPAFAGSPGFRAPEPSGGGLALAGLRLSLGTSPALVQHAWGIADTLDPDSEAEAEQDEAALPSEPRCWSATCSLVASTHVAKVIWERPPAPRPARLRSREPRVTRGPPVG